MILKNLSKKPPHGWVTQGHVHYCKKCSEGGTEQTKQKTSGIQQFLYQYVSETSECFYCGKILDEITVDHLMPESKGGTDNHYNLVFACQTCNNEKGLLSLHEYAQLKKHHLRHLHDIVAHTKGNQ